jgi:hypothetical protein
MLVDVVLLMRRSTVDDGRRGVISRMWETCRGPAFKTCSFDLHAWCAQHLISLLSLRIVSTLLYVAVDTIWFSVVETCYHRIVVVSCALHANGVRLPSVDAVDLM